MTEFLGGDNPDLPVYFSIWNNSVGQHFAGGMAAEKKSMFTTATTTPESFKSYLWYNFSMDQEPHVL